MSRGYHCSVEATILPALPMLKWLIALFVTVFIAGICLPRLMALLRLGRLPGDVRLKWRGREYVFPFATAVLLSLLATLVLRLL